MKNERSKTCKAKAQMTMGTNILNHLRLSILQRGPAYGGVVTAADVEWLTEAVLHKCGYRFIIQ